MWLWIRHLFCKSPIKWKEIYCDLEGWGDLHYLFKCEECGKDKCR